MNYEEVITAEGILLLISVFVTFGLIGALAFETIKNASIKSRAKGAHNSSK